MRGTISCLMHYRDPMAKIQIANDKCDQDKSVYIDIAFYSISQNFEKTLARFLQKIIASKSHALVVTKDKTHQETVDNYLWSYATESFLPHEIYTNQFADMQPILLIDSHDFVDKQVAFNFDSVIKNQANVVIFINGASSLMHSDNTEQECADSQEKIEQSVLSIKNKRIFFFYNINDSQELETIEIIWRSLIKYRPVYWEPKS
jgi:DNA polymerase IIIc chi subunit